MKIGKNSMFVVLAVVAVAVLIAVYAAVGGPGVLTGQVSTVEQPEEQEENSVSSEDSEDPQGSSSSQEPACTTCEASIFQGTDVPIGSRRCANTRLIQSGPHGMYQVTECIRQRGSASWEKPFVCRDEVIEHCNPETEYCREYIAPNGNLSAACVTREDPEPCTRCIDGTPVGSGVCYGNEETTTNNCKVNESGECYLVGEHCEEGYECEVSTTPDENGDFPARCVEAATRCPNGLPVGYSDCKTETVVQECIGETGQMYEEFDCEENGEPGSRCVEVVDDAGNRDATCIGPNISLVEVPYTCDVEELFSYPEINLENRRTEIDGHLRGSFGGVARYSAATCSIDCSCTATLSASASCHDLPNYSSTIQGSRCWRGLGGPGSPSMFNGGTYALPVEVVFYHSEEMDEEEITRRLRIECRILLQDGDNDQCPGRCEGAWETRADNRPSGELICAVSG